MLLAVIFDSNFQPFSGQVRLNVANNLPTIKRIMQSLVVSVLHDHGSAPAALEGSPGRHSQDFSIRRKRCL